MTDYPFTKGMRVRLTASALASAAQGRNNRRTGVVARYPSVCGTVSVITDGTITPRVYPPDFWEPIPPCNQ